MINIDTSRAELLSCPFCGSEAQTDFIDGVSYLIECAKCGSKTDFSDCADDAIEAWNTRAQPVDHNEMPKDQPSNTGVGLYCAPGPAFEQERRWLLRYEDADRRDVIIDREQTAREAFAAAEGSGWNCHLFEHALRDSMQPAEPQIDGYPLWSGLPPPVMSDAEILKSANEFISKNINHPDTFWLYDQNLIRFARFMRSAQADHVPDVINMVPQSPPITQPLIAEAARDDAFLINGQPLYDADLSLVCDYLTHETAFNGAAILSGWNELKRRAIAAIKRDDVAGDAMNQLRDALTRLVSSSAGIAAATDDDLTYAINDDAADPIIREQAAAVLQARAAIAASKKDAS